MSGTTSLSGEMTIAHIAACREHLLLALQARTEADAADTGAAGGALVLDLAGVELIDTAGIQLLLAARRSLAQGASRLVLTGVPAVVVEAIDLYGLRGSLLDGAGAST